MIILGIVGGLLAWVLLLGRFHPRSGNDVLRWRPTRSPELEVQNEIDDLAQMLEATNRRRRARGEPELTEYQLEEQVREDRRLVNSVRERYLDDQDLQQMLAATNTRRRARGVPELSEAQWRAELERGRPDA